MSDDPKLPKPQVIDPNLDEEWNAPSRSLDTEGRVVGAPLPQRTMSAPNAPVQPDDPSGLPRLASLKTGDLELVIDPASRVSGHTYEEPPSYRDDVYKVRSRKKAALVVVALLALGGAAFVFLPGSKVGQTLNAKTPKGPLVISSEPSGAELWLAGTKVGTTPWAVDNRYVGKTTWEVRMKGYKPKKGTFMGGEETHLDIELEPAE